MKPLLQLNGISFNYGERVVLKDVHLDVEDRSCVALIGPNGVGKTTLLRIASGGLQPASGSVLLNGLTLNDMAKKQRSRLLALVPQQLEVPFDFTVEEIVEQGRSPYLGFLHGPRLQDRRAVDRALDQTSLSALRQRVFNELSGGERQRVKIALGLAQQPQVLLLDEPTQNLDIGRQVELLDLLLSLRDSGLTILASVHDLHLIAGNFDCVHLLGQDHLFTSGSAAEILTTDNLTQAFKCPAGRHPLLARSLQESIA